MLSNLLISIIDNCPLFEQNCLLCGQRPVHDGLCHACRTALPWRAGHRCPCCHCPAPSPQAPCMDCRKLRPAFRHIYNAFDYGYPLDALISRCKYGPDASLQGTLAALMNEALQRAPQACLPDLVVPVPLASERLHERGFNLPDALARSLAATMRVRFDDTLCWRKRNTARQAKLSRRERLRNVRDAFGVKHRCNGLHIAIVDDVASTGATLHAMAKTLLQAGARQVDAWVLARAPFRRT